MILCSLSFLVGCSKADDQAGRSPSSETGMAGAADTAATSPMASLSAVAGSGRPWAISEAEATLGTAGADGDTGHDELDFDFSQFRSRFR